MTKAARLEYASDLKTRAFIAAFDRFIARRCLYLHISSDSGTHFVGTEHYFFELQRFVSLQEHSTQMPNHFALNSIEWHLNPPSVPHFAGLWEAAIKSIKFHIMRVVGLKILTLEDFHNIL